jgi:hypothetical protein
VPPLRLDDRREKKADLGFTSFYRKEMFSVLDQLIADCKRDWNRVFANIKPFSVLLPPWEEANEELVYVARQKNNKWKPSGRADVSSEKR